MPAPRVTRCPECGQTVNRPGYPDLAPHMRTHLWPEIRDHRPGCEEYPR